VGGPLLRSSARVNPQANSFSLHPVARMCSAVIKNTTRAAAVAALALSSLAVPASASGSTGTARAGIDCPPDYICIYPEINFGGQRAAMGTACRGRRREGPAVRDP
jgi:hypothetical protein